MGLWGVNVSWALSCGKVRYGNIAGWNVKGMFSNIASSIVKLSRSILR